MKTLVDLAYFYGAFLGDGTINKTFYFTEICGQDIDILEMAANGANNYFINLPAPKLYEYYRIYRLRWNNIKFSKYLYRQVSLLEYKDTVPQFILGGNYEIISAFLSGLFDTDGTIVETVRAVQVYLSGKKKFIYQVPELCNSVGLEKIFTREDSHNGFRIGISLNDLKKDIFNFRCERKQDKLIKWRSSL